MKVSLFWDNVARLDVLDELAKIDEVESIVIAPVDLPDGRIYRFLSIASRHTPIWIIPRAERIRESVVLDHWRAWTRRSNAFIYDEDYAFVMRGENHVPNVDMVVFELPTYDVLRSRDKIRSRHYKGLVRMIAKAVKRNKKVALYPMPPYWAESMDDVELVKDFIKKLVEDVEKKIAEDEAKKSGK